MVPLSRFMGATPTRAAVQCSQFRQGRQQRQGELLAHAGNGAQKVVLLPPHRTAAQRLLQALVQIVQFLLQPLNVKLYAGSNGGTGPPKRVFLATSMATLRLRRVVRE